VAEIRLHLELERASGVLAGIVAALAQQGLELKTQKLKRASEGRGGTLDIHAVGEPGDIEALAERMNAARGVSQVARIESDGEPVFADGALVLPEPDAADAEDIEAELDAFLEPEPRPPAPPPRDPDPDSLLQPELPPEPASIRPPAPQADDDELGPLLHPGTPDDEIAPTESRAGWSSASEPEPEPEPEAEPEPGQGQEPEPEPEAHDDDEPVSASGWGDEAVDDWAEDMVSDTVDHARVTDSESAPEPVPESVADLTANPESPAEDDEPSADIREDDNGSTERGDDPDRTEVTLRRRRRRRR